MTTQQKKYISITIKASIILLATWFIYAKLSDNKNLHNFLALIQKLERNSVRTVLIIILLLMLLNWFLESLKWHFLIKKVEQISLIKAIESVFCGLTWAVFTPNRIGEYGGRVFFLSPKRRIQGVVAMSVGQIAQMVITNIFGSLAILWFIHQFIALDSWLFFSFSFIIGLFCIFFSILYFNIYWLSNLFQTVNFLRRFKSFLRVLTRYKKKELGWVMILSIARFTVFTTQYLLIIHLLIPEIPYYQSALLVFILFFIQSALPSLDLLDIGIRSMTATYFFSFITHQDIAIMASAALIWLVNLIIPAILGAFFVLKLNFFGNNN